MANKSYKGRRFELWLAGELSRWWSGGDRDDVFYHSHDSGGRATRRHAKGKSTKGLYGDICAVDLLGASLLKVFCIEAKNGYSSSSLMDVFDKSDKAAEQLWEKWIIKAEYDSKAAETCGWMIVAKRNQRTPLVVLPLSLKLQLGVFIDEPSMCVELFVNNKFIFLYVCTLKNFLKCVSPDAIRRLLDVVEY